MQIIQQSLSAKKLASLQKRRDRAQQKITETRAEADGALPEAPCTLASDLRAIVTAKVIQGQVRSFFVYFYECLGLTQLSGV